MELIDKIFAAKSDELVDVLKLRDVRETTITGKSVLVDVGCRYDFFFERKSLILEVEMINDHEYSFKLMLDDPRVCEVLADSNDGVYHSELKKLADTLEENNDYLII